MRIVVKWTEQEKNQLNKLIEINTKDNRTDWVKIAKQMNRTANQCKTYYNIAIKQGEFKNCNANWLPHQIGQLLSCVEIYGKKWKQIQKTQFPQFSDKQVRSKYNMLQKMFQENKKMMELIREGKATKSNQEQIEKMFAYYSDLKEMYLSRDQKDILDQRALIKVNDKLNLEALVQSLKEILDQMNLQ
ncbi:Myb-like_DNA-binding domain-containing protein [Hexamita inflata]|uniref:Myb-like DNA-binding domain-containing protein n=1 Tax=Hexamita inflata TaxID=28002 RepID=A0AA86RHF9_9EUKA|nr:Myb-like DNA-binding domain-containing protein [Hexamita inflata]